MAWEVFSKISGQRQVRFLHGAFDEERQYQALQEGRMEKLEPGHDMSHGYLFVLTCMLEGTLQVVWSVVISQGTSYLISLGISASLTPLIWLCAPLCGMLVQPILGVFSDRSRCSWGRRRPFIVGGTAGAVLSMLLFAWIQDIVQILGTIVGLQATSLQMTMTLMAFVLVLALNVAVQSIQLGARSLIVENVPHHQQMMASAWASYQVGIGNIVGYVCGSIRLPELFLLPDITQFQCLSSIACLTLIATVLLSCYFIVEENPKSLSVLPKSHNSPSAIFKRVSHAYKKMPIRVWKLCQVQFCAWMGWFTFLFYGANYVAELYVASNLSTAPNITASQRSTARGEGTRVGSMAYLIFAIVGVSTNLILPSILKSTYWNGDLKPSSGREPSRDAGNHHSGYRFANAWAICETLFALCMLATFFVKSWVGVSVLIAYSGVSWAMAQWAPFTILGEVLSTLPGAEGSTEDSKGTILGLHNVAISAPQVPAALVSSGIFWIAREFGNQDGGVWVLRGGACVTLCAAYLAGKLDE